MIYFLSTQNKCNNNCPYCDLLNKKTEEEKTLCDLEEEIRLAKDRGYDTIKLSCNTDIRKDFIDLLKILHNHRLQVILETNGRIFFYRVLIRKISKYIKSYEILFDYANNSGNPYPARRQGQKIAGIKNIVDHVDTDTLTAKIILWGDNANNFRVLLSQVKGLGFKKLKVVLPLKGNANDPVYSLVRYVSMVKEIKDCIRQLGLELIIDWTVEYNPYITADRDFFDINKAELRFEKTIYKKKPAISVVIPTYNKSGYLGIVLKSFSAQKIDRSKYEIIVVDDGSTDGTGEMIKKMNFRCNIKYIYWPRKKLPANDFFRNWADFHNRAGLARNIGIKESRGEIILFNDNDVVVETDCLSRHLRHHSKNRSLVVKGLRWFVNDEFFNGRGLHDMTMRKIKNNASPEKTDIGKRLHCRVYDLKREGWQRVITYNLSIRKKIVEKAGLFHMDSPFWGYEDIDLGYRLHNLNLKFIWDGDINVYHLPHPVQTKNGLNSLSVLWLNLNILFRKYLDEEMYELYRDVILYKLENIINRKLC